MKIPLLAFNDKGIYCQQADVYLDPWRPVKNAIITHGHADHSRWGHQNYITHKTNVPIIRHRLGEINVTGKDWNETFVINNVKTQTSPRCSTLICALPIICPAGWSENFTLFITKVSFQSFPVTLISPNRCRIIGTLVLCVM